MTINPTITPERVGAMATQVINHLFPGNAGGVHILFLPKMVGILAPIAAEATKRQVPAHIRIKRNGFKFEISPDA